MAARSESEVTAVVVHWNQPGWCASTLESLSHQRVPVSAIVVDNGSRPEKLDELASVVHHAPVPAVLLPLGANTGFGPGANAGMRHWLDHRFGEWVAVMPHDALPEDGTIARLIEAAEGASAEGPVPVGLACADVGDGQTPVVDPYFGGMTRPATVSEGWEPADYPHGTLMIARRACLDAIGLFDERYFAYCEEADLGLRAKKAGWGVGLARGVMVKNPTMRSGSPAVDYLMHRNTLLLVREHSGPYHAFIRFNIAAFQLARGVVQPSSRAWLFSAKGRARGMLDFARGRYGPPPADLLADASDPP